MFEKVPLFSTLSDEEREALSSHVVTHVFPKNAVVIVEGDQTDALYVVVTGQVKVFLNDQDGKEVTLNIHGPNEYFGELALLDDAPRSASVMTLETSELSMISKRDFQQVLLNNPAIAIKLMQGLVRRIRDLTESVRDLALTEAYERVTRLLQRIATEHDGALRVERRLTHQDIASMVGTSREMVTRVLKDLTTGGYISIDHKRISILKKLPSKW